MKRGIVFVRHTSELRESRGEFSNTSHSDASLFQGKITFANPIIRSIFLNNKLFALARSRMERSGFYGFYAVPFERILQSPAHD